MISRFFGRYRSRFDLFSWLDFKLGVRMLSRYPGLTIVGGLAMAFAIWIGAGAFELITQYVRPRLPLPDGERIVGVQLLNTATQNVHARAMHDFVTWRDQLETIEDLSASREYKRNLIVEHDRGEPIKGVEITASAFRVARVPALLGRVLLDSDEHESAPPVMVIGHDIWQRRFDGAHDVIGRTVALGNVQHTVVGVMPQKFSFPVSHDVWTPLRSDITRFARGSGPGIIVFGRLAGDATMEDAQLELTNLGLRAAADFPDTHEHLRPRVMSYARSVVFVPNAEVVGLGFLNLFVLMLVVLMCGNVALLLFARAATREGEMVVRSALGAGRRRIIAQLFAEALVLGMVGAMIGLAGARFGLRWGLFAIEENLGRLPFWFDTKLSQTTLFYALGLTLLGAIIAGVVPALKVTRHVGDRLRQASAGGGGLKFGGIWTLVIVAQVAFTVAFPSTAYFIRGFRERVEAYDVGFPAEEYLSTRLEFEGDAAQLQRTWSELERKLLDEAAVAGVTFADRLPRMYHEERRIDVVEDAAPRDSILGLVVNAAFVAANYHDVLGAPILAGRGFSAADATSDHRVIIVNQSFVEHVLHGQNAIGRRVRFTQFKWDEKSEPNEWYEIVGVVKDLGMNYLNKKDRLPAGLYHPIAGLPASLHLVVKVRGDPAAFAPRLQAVAHSVDPALRLYDTLPMDELDAGVMKMMGIFMRVALIISSIALMLSLAGIYAVMSFAVSRRTREIGIRIALGADARRVMLAVFRRPFMQVGLGVLTGAWLVAQIAGRNAEGLPPRVILIVMAYAVVMMGVCFVACIVPVRRALAIQPTEALRDDA